MTPDRRFWVERFEPGWQRIDQRDVIMTRRRRHRQSHADFRAGLDSPRPVLWSIVRRGEAIPMAVSECVYGVGRFVYSLVGMGMQRVDAAAFGAP